LPGTPETVRVNGTATLTADPELLARLPARGKPAGPAVRVRAEEGLPPRAARAAGGARHARGALDPDPRRGVLPPLREGVHPQQALETGELVRAAPDLVRCDGGQADEARRRRRGEIRCRGRGRLPHQSLVASAAERR